MFTVKESLTNRRPTKEQEPQLIVKTGLLTITEPATKAMGLQAEDYVRVVEGENEDGEQVFALCKVDAEAGGAKLAGHNDKVTGNLNFSAAYAIQVLQNGNEDDKVYQVYDVDIENPQEDGDTTYFMMTFKEEVAKPQRTKKAEVDGEVED